VEQIAAIEKDIADWITLNVTIYVLIGVGLFLTARSLFVQVRLFPEMIRTVLGSRKGADGGISSFQAFAISLAARVGIGNVFGVAAALLMGAVATSPLARAAGLGLNAVVAFTLVLGAGLSYGEAMGIIAWEGILIFLLVLTGFRVDPAGWWGLEAVAGWTSWLSPGARPGPTAPTACPTTRSSTRA